MRQFHWVTFCNLLRTYQYQSFVNRSLLMLDEYKDGLLPPVSDFFTRTKAQDVT